MKFRLGDSNSRLHAPQGVRAKGCLSAFFGVLSLFGIAFLIILSFQLVRTWKSYEWPQHTATIVENEIAFPKGSEDGYRLKLRYKYQFEGKEYESSGVSTDNTTSYDYSKLARLAEQFPEGAEVTCYVNPQDPDEAILQHESAWIALMILVPIPFLLVGLGGLWFTWRGASDSSIASTSKLGAGRAKLSGAFLPIFFGIFTVVGGILTVVITVGAWRDYFAARQWQEMPCTVEFSRVRSHDSDDGTTYSVDILYRYEVDGQAFRSNRYTFAGGSSSGYQGKKRIVDQHPVGKQTICYVDSNDPYRAVLLRDLDWSMLFTFIPLPFLLVGVGGLIYWWTHRRSSGEQRPAIGAPSGLDQYDWLPASRSGIGGSGPITLKPETGRVGKFMGLLFIALFWCGITSIFVVLAVDGYRQGNPDWFLTLFISPFVLVGIGLILASGWQFLRLFNPQVELHVASDRIALGGPLRIRWNFQGQVHWVQRFRLTFEGQEKATYRQGTKTRTDTSVFHRLTVVELYQRERIRQGETELVVPEETMHTFLADNNEIKWYLKVQGEIRFWPDIDQEFPIVVLPRACQRKPHLTG